MGLRHVSALAGVKHVGFSPFQGLQPRAVAVVIQADECASGSVHDAILPEGADPRGNGRLIDIQHYRGEVEAVPRPERHARLDFTIQVKSTIDDKQAVVGFDTGWLQCRCPQFKGGRRGADHQAIAHMADTAVLEGEQRPIRRWIARARWRPEPPMYQHVLTLVTAANDPAVEQMQRRLFHRDQRGKVHHRTASPERQPLERQRSVHEDQRLGVVCRDQDRRKALGGADGQRFAAKAKGIHQTLVRKPRFDDVTRVGGRHDIRQA